MVTIKVTPRKKCLGTVGYAKEHNYTQLHIQIDKRIQGCSVYDAEFSMANEEKFLLHDLEIKDNEYVVVPLKDIVLVQGKLEIQIVGHQAESDMVVKSCVYNGIVAESVNAFADAILEENPTLLEQLYNDVVWIKENLGNIEINIKIPDDSVDTDNIKNGAVTPEKLSQSYATEQYVNDELNKIASSCGQIQSNYTENDDASLAHIKNRPFYKEIVYEEPFIIPSYTGNEVSTNEIELHTGQREKMFKIADLNVNHKTFIKALSKITSRSYGNSVKVDTKIYEENLSLAWSKHLHVVAVGKATERTITYTNDLGETYSRTIVYPEPGIYLSLPYDIISGQWINNFNESELIFEPYIKKIEQEFLPDIAYIYDSEVKENSKNAVTSEAVFKAINAIEIPDSFEIPDGSITPTKLDREYTEKDDFDENIDALYAEIDMFFDIDGHGNPLFIYNPVVTPEDKDKLLCVDENGQWIAKDISDDYASKEYVDEKISEIDITDSLVQADMSQNDPTQMDYIKNRIAYYGRRFEDIDIIERPEPVLGYGARESAAETPMFIKIGEIPEGSTIIDVVDEFIGYVEDDDDVYRIDDPNYVPPRYEPLLLKTTAYNEKGSLIGMGVIFDGDPLVLIAKEDDIEFDWQYHIEFEGEEFTGPIYHLRFPEKGIYCPITGYDLVDGNIVYHTYSKLLFRDKKRVDRALLPMIPIKLSELETDVKHQLVTDNEKFTWNNKSNFSGKYEDLTDKPEIPSIEGLATEEYVDSALKSVSFELDETLTYKNGKLAVNTTNELSEDNTLPITSAAVQMQIGNIEELLKTI